MSIIKNMQGVIRPKMTGMLSNIPKGYGLTESAIQNMESVLSGELDCLHATTKSTIGAQGDDFFEWSGKHPKRNGTEYVSRVDFWASKSSTFEAVPFVTENARIVFPWFIHNGVAFCSDLTDTKGCSVPVAKLLPMFPRDVKEFTHDYLPRSVEAKFNLYFGRVMLVVKDMDTLRTKWLAGTAEYETPEAISELDEDNSTERSRRNEQAAYDRRTRPLHAHNIRGNWNPTPTPDVTIERDLLVAGTITGRWKEENENKSNTPKSIKEENNTMTKSSQVKSNIVDTHKDALKAVGYLNGGRASNKLTKEAVRPMLNAMFKPNFMQRIGMKLFGLKNPVEVALQHPASDFFCAELANLIVEIKGVENEHVREVSKAGIVYSGMELSKLIPFEEAMDKVVAHLEDGAGKVVEKMKK